MLVALLVLSYRCTVTINVLWFFLTMPWVDLQCVILGFPGHTHLLFVFMAFVYLLILPLTNLEILIQNRFARSYTVCLGSTGQGLQDNL